MKESCFIETECGMVEGSNKGEASNLKRGDFHQDVPAFTVLVDGGWSKHSQPSWLQCKFGCGCYQH